jgi:lipoprotein-releasing system permease protein
MYSAFCLLPFAFCLLPFAFCLLSPMRYEMFLAIRHLRSRQRRRLARVTSLIAVVGIAVGVAALIVALSLANGFRDEIRDKILRGTAHLTVMRNDGRAMIEYPEVAAKVAAIPGVVAASGTTYDGAVIVGPQSSAYAVLRGIEPASAIDITQSLLSGSTDRVFAVSESSNEPPDVIIGSELAMRTGLKLGDTADVIVASANVSSSIATRRRVRVAGTFRSGLFEYDSTWIYLPLASAAAFAGETHAASVISVKVANIYDVKTISAEAKQRLGSAYATVDWQEANRPLFTALALERRIGVVIIGLIVFIAVLNIMTTLIMVVVERRRDIAILNTMGANARSIMSIFVIQGAIVGLVGALAGVVLGLVAIMVANRYRLISLPADVYSISSVSFNVSLRDTAFAAATALVLSVIATLYPARAAARVRPAEMLRETS